MRNRWVVIGGRQGVAGRPTGPERADAVGAVDRSVGHPRVRSHISQIRPHPAIWPAADSSSSSATRRLRGWTGRNGRRPVGHGRPPVPADLRRGGYVHRRSAQVGDAHCAG